MTIWSKISRNKLSSAIIETIIGGKWNYYISQGRYFIYNAIDVSLVDIELVLEKIPEVKKLLPHAKSWTDEVLKTMIDSNIVF
jgi:hypothetical protein